MKHQVLLSGLFAVLLTVTACSTPAPVPAAPAATEAPAAEATMTSTEEMTETESMDETDAMTMTDDMAATDEMTMTEDMSMTDEMTMTEDMSMTDEMTMTEEMSMTEEMTDEMMAAGTSFRVRVENISGDSSVPTPFSPGAWVVFSELGPIFLTGEANRGAGLEAQAEDANPTQLDATLEAAGFTHGIFNTPVDAPMAGAATPGNAFEFTVTTTIEMPMLAFASMFGQSNDLFIGPDENGIALFDADGNPVSGDVTDQIQLWDAGSEMNEEPGVGANQAPRQPAPNTGPVDDDNTVRLVNDGFTYPTIAELVIVTIEPVEMMK